MNSVIKDGGLKELEFGGNSLCVSGGNSRGGLIVLGKLVDPG